jgi:hypothetical protein
MFWGDPVAAWIRSWLRAEGLATFAAGLAGFLCLGLPWWAFLLLLIVLVLEREPDMGRWSELLESLGIDVVWPATLDAHLARLMEAGG